MKVKDIVSKQNLEEIAQNETPSEIVSEEEKKTKKGRVRDKLGKAFNFILDAMQVAGTVAEVVGALVPAVGVAGGVANKIISSVKATAQGSEIVDMFKDAGEMFNNKQQVAEMEA